MHISMSSSSPVIGHCISTEMSPWQLFAYLHTMKPDPCRIHHPSCCRCWWRLRRPSSPRHRWGSRGRVAPISSWLVSLGCGVPKLGMVGFKRKMTTASRRRWWRPAYCIPTARQRARCTSHACRRDLPHNLFRNLRKDDWKFRWGNWRWE